MDTTPTAIVDQFFQYASKIVEENFLNAVDGFTVALQFNHVLVSPRSYDTMTWPENFAEATVKPMAGGVLMMSAGNGSTHLKSLAPASTSR